MGGRTDTLPRAAAEPGLRPGPVDDGVLSRRGLARLQRWLSRRIRPVAGPYVLTRRRIYVLPTRAGVLFGGAMLTMLLTAINYSLSLGYVLTFVLTSLAVLSMLHTFRTLAGLELRPGRAEPVFAGEVAEFIITLSSHSRRDRLALRIDVPGAAAPHFADVPSGAQVIVALPLTTRRRGRLVMPALRISSTFPLGLWQAWAWWQPDIRLMVWPQPEHPAVPVPPGEPLPDGRQNLPTPGDDDLAALRPYRPGDSMRRFAWRAMARLGTDEALVKSMEGQSGPDALLSWRSLPPQLDTESRIARLTRWVVDAERAGRRFGLQLPGQTLGVDSGAGHRARALEMLALMPGTPEDVVTVRPA